MSMISLLQLYSLYFNTQTFDYRKIHSLPKYFTEKYTRATCKSEYIRYIIENHCRFLMNKSEISKIFFRGGERGF
jgi:hypothetical protein